MKIMLVLLTALIFSSNAMAGLGSTMSLNYKCVRHDGAEATFSIVKDWLLGNYVTLSENPAAPLAFKWTGDEELLGTSELLSQLGHDDGKQNGSLADSLRLNVSVQKTFVRFQTNLHSSLGNGTYNQVLYMEGGLLSAFTHGQLVLTGKPMGMRNAKSHPSAISSFNCERIP